MKIILINPPEYCNTERIAPDYLYQTNAFNYPPLGLLYLASNLEGNHESKIIDAPTQGYSLNDCMEEIIEYKPSLVGITVFTDSLYSCRILAEKIKVFDPTIKVVFGGPHSNIYPEETIRFPMVDYVLTGFAESSFACLVENVDRGQNTTDSVFASMAGLWWKDGTAIKKSKCCDDAVWNINRIKRPNRGLINYEKYFTVANRKIITTMISSRGCPFSCTFCDVLERRYLQRDIPDIITEVKEILDLGVDQIHFFDDCFNLKRDRVVKICRAFIDNNLKFEWSFRGRLEPCDEALVRLLYKAGCRRVQLGIEGTDQDTIDRIKKRIDVSKVPAVVKIYHDNGIETMGYFILGFPFQTYKDCVFSCEKILRMGFDYINMFILIPYPKTAIYRELLDAGLIKKDYWHEHAVNPHPDFKLEQWHPSLTRKELEELLNSYYKKFYFSPKFIFSELRRTRSMKDFIKKFKVAVAMIKNKFDAK